MKVEASGCVAQLFSVSRFSNPEMMREMPEMMREMKVVLDTIFIALSATTHTPGPSQGRGGCGSAHGSRAPITTPSPTVVVRRAGEWGSASLET